MRGKYGTSMQAMEVLPHRHKHCCKNCTYLVKGQPNVCSQKNKTVPAKAVVRCRQFVSKRAMQRSIDSAHSRQIADVPASQWSEKDLRKIRELNAKIEKGKR